MTQLNPQQPKAMGSTTLVLVALGLALVAVLLTNFYIDAVRQNVRHNSFVAYVLTRRVLPGDKLKANDVKEVLVPQDFHDSFVDQNFVDHDALQIKLTDAETVQHTASAGSLLTHALFIAPGNADLDRAITPGKRLISLPVDSRRVPGELHPGLYVDLQAAFNTGAAVPIVLPVMEYVRVTAVGSRTLADERDDNGRQRSSGTVRTISIEVTPEEATDLNMLDRIMVGDFELLVRNPADTAISQIKAGGINPRALELLDTKKHEAAPKKNF